jgi:hypothetical protein
MNRHFPHHRLVRPVELNRAADAAAVKDASRRQGRWPRARNKIALTTSRKLVRRVRPRLAGSGRCGAISTHSSSVVSLA